MLKLGIVGYGYWGPNLVRNFANLDNCEVVKVADSNPLRLAHLKKLYPAVEGTNDPMSLISDSNIDGIAVVTPVSTHFGLAKAALQAGKHVLVTKPMTQTSKEAQELIRIAERQKRVLLTDHTFIYSGPVQKIRELIDRNELGNIYYYDSVRVNLGLFQADVNVLWDLAPHDFAIMSYLIKKRPITVSAMGAKPINYNSKPLESVAYATIRFDDDSIGHVHVSWISPVKVRRTLIGGSQKMIVYDHLDPDNQVKVYDKGVDVRSVEQQHQALVQYRLGDMYAPKVEQTEALEAECRHFVDCCMGKTKPLTDGYEGLRVVRLLEAAQLSMNAGGTSVVIDKVTRSIQTDSVYVGNA